MSEFDGTLDLTGAKPDEIGFPAIPSGSYEAHVGKAEWRTTDNLDGTKKLPHETPYLALGIRVNEDVEPRNDQRVAGVYAGWTNLYVPPPDYDASARQRMNNMMANFLNAIGEDWQKKNYKMPDVEELIGKPVTVIVRKKYNKQQDKDVNEIEGFKVAGSSTQVESGLLV
jgi:uncharacterized protein DUF669